MTEREWVSLIAELLSAEPFGEYFEVKTGLNLCYAHEINSYGDVPDLRKQEFETDLAIVETVGPGQWKPRVVVEAKIGNSEGRMPMTHDAIIYSHKAASHKAVHPYLRYGIMLGHRKHYSLPGRLYRHGTQFDFMISFAEFQPTMQELRTFRGILSDELQASRTLESMLYDTRRRDRDHHTVLHRKLIVGTTEPV